MNDRHIVVAIAAMMFAACGAPPQANPAISQTASDSEDAVAKLPSHVKAEKGRLTLFADFEHKSERGVPVYLVNRTGKELELRHPADHFFIALEYERAPNQWIRAEPRSVYFGCSFGNSPIGMADDSFVMQQGYVPNKGTKAKVRYSTYWQPFEVVSNVTEGFILEDDVHKAGSDSLSIYTGSFDFVSKVARGELKLTHEVEDLLPRDLRWLAIWELNDARFPRDKAEMVLQSIADGKEDEYAKQAKEELKELKSRK